jgi:UDP-3-O-acyl-N-acetylglucosamine deacetylase
MPRGVTMVEHVLAALSGLRIDNCMVEVDNLEPPGLDGSAGPYVRALNQAGRILQPVARTIWAVDQPIIVRQSGASLAIYPPADRELHVTYFLEYGLSSPIGMQRHFETITPQNFAGALADCRTYLTEAEALELRRRGVGTRTKINDLVIFGPHGPMENRLRFADEPSRHKVLDVVGDLALTGHDIRGQVLACRSGHPLNVELARQLIRAVESNGHARKRAA